MALKSLILFFISMALVMIASVAFAETDPAIVVAAITPSIWLEPATLLSLATSIIGVFALIAAITPNTLDNRIADFLLKVINLLGANVLNAKNSKKSE